MNTIRPFKHLAIALVVAGVSILRAGICAVAAPPAIGVMGDSYADEYQFDPDFRAARNFVEILHDLRGVDFGPVSTTSLGSPRFQGFSYDWALANAASGDLGPQATGLAKQIAAGKVQEAWIFIGGNDFLHAAEGPNPTVTLPDVPAQLLANVTQAVGTLLSANPTANVLISNLGSLTSVPAAQFLVQTGVITPTELTQIDGLIAGYNAALASALAGNARVTVVDFATQSAALFSTPTLMVGGVTIDRQTPSNDYHSLFLPDGLHPGTVGQGLLGNAFVNAANSVFHDGIKPLAQPEIIGYAAAVPQAVPLPPAWAAGGAMLLALAVCLGLFRPVALRSWAS